MTKLTKKQFLEHVEEAMKPPEIPDMAGAKETLLQQARQMPRKKGKEPDDVNAVRPPNGGQRI